MFTILISIVSIAISIITILKVKTINEVLKENDKILKELRRK